MFSGTGEEECFVLACFVVFFGWSSPAEEYEEECRGRRDGRDRFWGFRRLDERGRWDDVEDESSLDDEDESSLDDDDDEEYWSVRLSSDRCRFDRSLVLDFFGTVDSFSGGFVWLFLFVSWEGLVE